MPRRQEASTSKLACAPQYEIFFNADESGALVFERYRDADAALEHFANISHLIALLVEAQIPGNLTSIMIPALRHFQRLRCPRPSRGTRADARD